MFMSVTAGLEDGMLRNGGEAVIGDHTSVAPRNEKDQKSKTCLLREGGSHPRSVELTENKTGL